MSLEEQHYLNFADAYINEQYLYAVGFEHNIFFRAKRTNYDQTEVLGVLNGFQCENAGRICSIQYYKNSLYMFPNRSYEAVRYDIETGKLTYYVPGRCNEIFNKVRGVCRIQNSVWIFQNIFEGVLCVFSLENGTYRFYDLDISSLLNCTNWKENEKVVLENICLIGNKVWRCIPYTNYIYSIDIETKDLEVHKLDLELEIFTISHDGKNLYITSVTGDQMICWNEEQGIIEKKSIDYEEKVFGAFRNVIRDDERCILIPGNFSKIMILENQSGIVKSFGLPMEFQRLCDSRKEIFLNYFREGTRILLFPFSGNGLIEIDVSEEKARYFPVFLSEEAYIDCQMKSERSHAEDELKNLKRYLASIKDGNDTGSRKSKSKHNGMDIMKELKRS